MPKLLPVIRQGTLAPSLILLHFFGGSGREWNEVAAVLRSKYECISMDLPGFGDAADIAGDTVEEMGRQVAETIRSLGLDSFVLVGHSMSGKLSLLLAAQKISGLHGLVLVAPSPPCPEPIPEPDRRKMLAMRRERADAETFLDRITANPLPGNIRERAIDDFMRCSPTAWSAWLKSGSKEDWSERIGVVHCPTLMVTGDSDPSLGASVQKRLTLPHLSQVEVAIIPQCGHLPTMEASGQLSSLIDTFVNHGTGDED